MSKQLLFALCCAVIFLASCTQDPYKALPGIGDTVYLQDSICVTLQLTERSTTLGDLTSSTGREFLSTQVILENYSGKDYYFFNSQFSLQAADASNYKTLLSSAKKPPLGPSGKLLNGSTKQGWLSFEVPVDMEKLQLSFVTDMIGGDSCFLKLEE